MFRNAHRIYDERTPAEIASLMEGVIRGQVFRTPTVERLSAYIGADPRRVFNIAMKDERFIAELTHERGITETRVKLK